MDNEREATYRKFRRLVQDIDAVITVSDVELGLVILAFASLLGDEVAALERDREEVLALFTTNYNHAYYTYTPETE